MAKRDRRSVGVTFDFDLTTLTIDELKDEIDGRRNCAALGVYHRDLRILRNELSRLLSELESRGVSGY
jgi:hypothetical protein